MWNRFRQLWLVDFEFSAAPGERPTPLCFVARELHTGRLLRHWLADGDVPSLPPYNTGRDALFVAYYASAEFGCHLAVNWPMPAHTLDLYAEFRLKTSGLLPPCGYGLLGALAAHGLDRIDVADKEAMRALAMRRGPYSEDERRALLDYCQSDVDALVKLLPAMLPGIDLPRALLRGRYMQAAAKMEWVGTPVDVPLLEALRSGWEDIQAQLIASIDNERGIYAGRSFNVKNFSSWLSREGIPWPYLDSGGLNLSDQTFRDMARAYPNQIGPVRELRHALSQLRLEELAVGKDGRNRTLLSAFGSRTGRNQPSNKAFIFGPSTWLRSLIRPAEGKALAYVDYEQQEFGIAAALSKDPDMQEAYTSGDPYLTFAKQAGAVPPGATKQTHGIERERFKVLALAVQYGMGPESLSQRLNMSTAQARALISLHKRAYPQYWHWSDAVEAHAMLHGHLMASFGWRVNVGPDANPRSLRNFPLQANGAEMLRLACILATEGGINVCCPVHDALLIEAPVDRIQEEVADTQHVMCQASLAVLPGFPLRTDAKVVCWPDRYVDGRGRQFWTTICHLLEERAGARVHQKWCMDATPVPLITLIP